MISCSKTHDCKFLPVTVGVKPNSVENMHNRKHWIWLVLDITACEQLPPDANPNPTLNASSHYTTQRSYDSASHEQWCEQTLHTIWADCWAPRLAHAHFTFCHSKCAIEVHNVSWRFDMSNLTSGPISRATGKLARMATSCMCHNTSRRIIQMRVV